ncbi:MAG: hypothetical protein LUI12_05045 [Clostridiales bacterium]|nr:hypothetical protein [Clostridiales bacterium]
MQKFIIVPTDLINDLHEDKPYSKLRAYIDIFEMAGEKGEFYSTTRKLMERWGWSNTRVSSLLEDLEKKDIIKIIKRHKKDTRYMIDSDFFLVFGIEKKTQKSHKKDTNKTQEDSKTSGKEQMYFPNDELLESAFREFLVMRDKIKKPLATKQALTRAINKVNKLSGGDNDLAIKILNQSTDHCWQDLYELKEDNRNNSFTKNGERDILREWRNS